MRDDIIFESTIALLNHTVKHSRPRERSPIELTGLVRSHKNMRIRPDCPLTKHHLSEQPHILNRVTYSAGVAKSALSVPAESCTDTVTRSFPLPPLPKLLFWKLKTGYESYRTVVRVRRGLLERGLGKAVFVGNIMDGIDNIESIDTGGVQVVGRGGGLRGVLSKVKYEIGGRLGSRCGLGTFERNYIVPTGCKSQYHYVRIYRC